MKILFLHGWTSTPGGKKPTFLKAHGHEVRLSPMKTLKSQSRSPKPNTISINLM
jgi:hypothetical protein